MAQRPALGRLLRWDERSKAFPAVTASVQSVDHKHSGVVLNQGNLGSCTGNAAIQNLATAPLHKTGERASEAKARAVYSLATKLDGLAGTWPPTDCGSSGLGAAAACKQLGYISSYTHAFGLDHALGALALGPVMVGSGWYESMFEVNAQGFVAIGGPIVGGHEYSLIGIDVQRQAVRLLNSWGASWGSKGTAWLSFADLDRLLSEDGDVTVLQR